MKPLATDIETLTSFSVPALSPAYFTTTSIAPTTAARFLNSISAEELDFVDRISTANTHSSDLTVFREHPLLRRSSEYTPLDLGFILDKAGRGLFWIALKNCPGTERPALLQQWGELFERYVSGVLATSLGEPVSIFLDQPTFADNAEASDSAIREGTTLILLEYKADNIKSAIKYADDPVSLQEVLESRFVKGEGGRRKGLTQLWHAIKRFAEGDAIIGQTSELRIEPHSIRKIVID